MYISKEDVIAVRMKDYEIIKKGIAMVEIIKKGKMPEKKKIFFGCRNCGTEFKAEESDCDLYVVDGFFGEAIPVEVSCKCPLCKKEVKKPYKEGKR